MDHSGHIHPPDLAEKLRGGHRLRVFLEPDQSLFESTGGMPDYIECYNLPIVTIQDNKFWGMTRSTHLIVDKKFNIAQVCSFAYTNALPVYCIAFNEEILNSVRNNKMVVKFMSAMQYLSMRFILAEPGRLIWSDLAPDDTKAVADSIQRGEHFYIVAEMDDRHTLSLPLDLTFFTTANSGLEFRSEVHSIPSYFRDIADFIGHMEKDAQTKSVSLHETLINPMFSVESEIQCALLYYRFHLDRTYASLSDVVKDERKPLKTMKVFAFP